MDKERKTVEAILRHSRHDWLNKLQLIKGNIELNNIDRAKAVIEEIIIEAHHEAMLSNLNMPELAETLLTANWRSLPLHIEFEVVELQRGLRDMDTLISAWVEELFRILADSLDDYGENVLAISIDENKEYNLRLSFELQGTIKNESVLHNFLNKSVRDKADVKVLEINSEEAVFLVELYGN
ncbi:Spo0B C-terminal domain-containing protein [Bacillus sp. CECT 9360]|uniref:Spo0B C-terminal domain-containing protein n=1 Tax=Bacillus sp. CECT 9360 TaxID=2845821 RepID=UPI001E49B5A6|nr:Spo0B C-terminal domain-containing protein [Bacillus sp. CECT 9360]CAH0346361.1 Sporulation initiation phosphotransferase B [Bacillus sp. CECT 9360]